MVDFKIISKDKIDKNEIIKFLKIRGEKDSNLVPNEDSIINYVDSLISFLNYHILAYVDNKLLGWLGLIEVNPSLLILYEWHPLIMPCESKIQIGQKLLNKAFEFANRNSFSNIRTFIDVVKQREPQFQELQNLLESMRMKKTHTCYCMEHTLSKNDVKNIKKPSDMIITSLISKNKDELQFAYDQIFENSFDDFINSLDEEERSFWSFFNLDKNSESSVVLEHKNKIIGFVGARDYGDYIEFGPVGVLPDYRGKGLSKLLMNSVYSNLIDLKRINGYIEVGVRNKPAFNLYTEYGFRTVSEKHGFLIRLK